MVCPVDITTFQGPNTNMCHVVQEGTTSQVFYQTADGIHAASTATKEQAARMMGTAGRPNDNLSLCCKSKFNGTTQQFVHQAERAACSANDNMQLMQRAGAHSFKRPAKVVVASLGMFAVTAASAYQAGWILGEALSDGNISWTEGCNFAVEALVATPKDVLELGVALLAPGDVGTNMDRICDVSDDGGFEAIGEFAGKAFDFLAGIFS